LKKIKLSDFEELFDNVIDIVKNMESSTYSWFWMG